MKSQSFQNAYFCGDIVTTRHGSWSQEKAYVSGIEVANIIRKKPLSNNVVQLSEDEPHVAFGRTVVRSFQAALGAKAPSLVDFLS